MRNGVLPEIKDNVIVDTESTATYKRTFVSSPLTSDDSETVKHIEDAIQAAKEPKDVPEVVQSDRVRISKPRVGRPSKGYGSP